MYSSFHVPPAWRHTASKIIVIGSKTCQNCLRSRCCTYNVTTTRSYFKTQRIKPLLFRSQDSKRGMLALSSKKVRETRLLQAIRFCPRYPSSSNTTMATVQWREERLCGVSPVSCCLLKSQDDLDQSHKCCRGSTLCMGICTSNKLQFLLLVTLIISVFKMWI